MGAQTGGNGQDVSVEDVMRMRSKCFDISNQVQKGVFFALEQQVGALLAQGVRAKDIEIGVGQLPLSVKPKSNIVAATLIPQNLGDLKRGG